MIYSGIPFCDTEDSEIERIRSAIQKEAVESQAKKKYLGDIVKERVKSGKAASSQYGGATPRTAGAPSSKGMTSRIDSAGTKHSVSKAIQFCLLN